MQTLTDFAVQDENKSDETESSIEEALNETGINFVTKYKETLAKEVNKEEIKTQIDKTFRIVKAYLDKMKPAEEEKKKEGEAIVEEEAPKVNEEDDEATLDRAES